MPKKNINIQNKHIRECNWINKKNIFYKDIFMKNLMIE